MAETKITQNEVAPVYHQSGWNYTTVVSTTNVSSVTVTFPTAFATPPKVIVGLLGWKSTTGGAPTAITDFTGNFGAAFAVACFAYNISTTGFTVAINAGTSNNFGASYNGFSWIAEI